MRVVNWLINLHNQYIIRKYDVKVGRNLEINGRLELVAPIYLEIGNNVKINSGLVNPVGHEMSTLFFTTTNGKIIIGNNVGISNSTFFSAKEICVEDNVFIGGGCRIYDTDFHPIDYTKRISLSEDIASDRVHIKNGAFIGGHTIILKGVTIGEKSVIGAGSVVTKDIPDYEVWAGNPAHYIKTLENAEE